MSFKLGLLGGFAVAACFLSTGAQAANLLTNGSFEADANFQQGGHVGDDELASGSTTLPGWTVVGVGLIGWFSPANAYDISASDGSYSLDLTGDTDGAGGFGGVQQSVHTVKGATYHLTFDLGSDLQYGVPVSVLASAGGSSQTFSSSLINLSDPNANAWAHDSFEFVATGTTTLVTLQATAGNHYIGLDNVALDGPAGVAGVPEPAAWALMLVGFSGLGASLRRQRRVTAAAA